MTDDRHLTDDHLTDDHLTDEQLSSHLDATLPLTAHLGRCAMCRDRLAALAAARELVRTPVPPVGPEVRAASIATVLQRASSTHDDAPVPIRVHKRPRVLVGATAAVLALAVAVGVPLALSGTTSSENSSNPASATRAGTRPPQALRHPSTFGAQSSGADSLPETAIAASSDLGRLDSVDGLRSRLRDLSGTASAPAPGQGDLRTLAPAGSASRFEHCLASALHAAGLGRSVQTLATATYKGTPALVFVFLPVSAGSGSTSAADSVAVVTATEGCRVLGTTPL